MIRPCADADFEEIESVSNEAADAWRGVIPADCWYEPYVRDVTLIRHAYVRTAHRGRGIGSALLEFLADHTTGPLLVGTWAAAEWAIRFYERHGFRLVSPAGKDSLLSSYWSIPLRQKEASVVLASTRTVRAARPAVAYAVEPLDQTCR